MKTYLDIETSFSGEITVVGMYRPSKGMIQFVGNDITPEKLIEYLDGSQTICTYNGSRFDILVIKNVLGLDLFEHYESHDLMFDCWSQNLYGGLKAVEKQLGIKRVLDELSGYDALLLWQKFQEYNDLKALETLLQYNKEDVLNLLILEDKLFCS